MDTRYMEWDQKHEGKNGYEIRTYGMRMWKRKMCIQGMCINEIKI